MSSGRPLPLLSFRITSFETLALSSEPDTNLMPPCPHASVIIITTEYCVFKGTGMTVLPRYPAFSRSFEEKSNNTLLA